MMSYFVSTLKQWCTFEKFLTSSTLSRIKGRQLESGCHFLFSTLKQWCPCQKCFTSSTLSSIMGRQLESYDIVFIFHPKTLVHLLEISYQLYPFQNKGETTRESWCHILFSTIKQWCTFEKFLISSRIKGRQLESWCNFLFSTLNQWCTF